jgi:hypothetical protein
MAETLENIMKFGGLKAKSAKQGSISWFLRTVRGLRKNGKSTTAMQTSGPGLAGQMIAFSYDPKHKKTLPYYDRYPIVVPLSLDAKGFLGLNLHYLPPRVRLGFIRALQQFAVEKNGKKQLVLSYRLVKAARSLSAFAPCIKSYLHGHVRSKFVVIDPKEWEHAALLPLARFIGASEEEVWKDSTEKRRSTRRES